MRKPDSRSFGSSVPSGSQATCWQTRSFGIAAPRSMPALTRAFQHPILWRMRPKEGLTLEQIKLGEPAFWMLPPDIREGPFQTLLRKRPISFYQEIDDRVFTPGPGCCALSR